MPPSTHINRRPARLRRVAAAALVVATVVTVADGGSGSVEAAPRTKSAVIATEADRALEALDRWSQSQNPADYIRFVQARELTATLTAVDLELDPAAMRDAWGEASTEKQYAVLSAMTQLGVPYESIASKPGVGFDCSGLMIWAFAEAGVEIPRVSGDQIDASESIELATAEPGDLVHYPGHIGMYLGADAYVHSPETGSHVEAVHLPDKSLRFGDAVAGD